MEGGFAAMHAHGAAGGSGWWRIGIATVPIGRSGVVRCHIGWSGCSSGGFGRSEPSWVLFRLEMRLFYKCQGLLHE